MEREPRLLARLAVAGLLGEEARSELGSALFVANDAELQLAIADALYAIEWWSPALAARG